VVLHGVVLESVPRLMMWGACVADGACVLNWWRVCF